MELKLKLQRMLQIIEESERTGGLADIERDIILNDLRELYAELRFGKTEREAEPIVPTPPVAPVAPIAPIEEEHEEEHEHEESEPEVEVELIFDEESDEEEPATTEPTVVESTVEKEEKTSIPDAPLSTPKRSALLSLYEDAPTPVLGEQFHEALSVADTIACPKGVAESTPVVSLREAIGVADKFMLIRELFGGDADAYEQAVEMLDKQSSFDDCIIYISENYTWSPNAEGAKMMMELLQRKYN